MAEFDISGWPEEAKDTQDGIMGTASYMEMLNKKYGVVRILGKNSDCNYYDRLKLLAEKIKTLFDEIHSDLSGYSRIMRYVGQAERNNLCRVINSLYQVIRITGSPEGKKSACIGILTLGDKATMLLSKATNKEVQAAAQKVLNGKYLNKQTRYDTAKKAAQSGPKYAVGNSAEKAAFLYDVGGSYGKEFFVDVMNLIHYQSDPSKAKGKSGKTICTKDYTAYIEKSLFGKQVTVSDTKDYAAYVTDGLAELAAELANDLSGKPKTDFFIHSENAERIKMALAQASKCGFSAKKGTVELVNELALEFYEDMIYSDAFMSRFDVKDVTDELNKVMREGAREFMVQFGDIFWFALQVRTNARYDLKNSDERFKGFRRCIYEGKLYRADAPGNISYGYFGAAAKIAEPMLLVSAGVYQIYSDVSSRNDWGGLNRIFPNFGDNQGDQDFIRIGIDKFKEDWYGGRIKAPPGY